MTPRFLARVARWIEVTFPEREEPGGSRFDREIVSILDVLNLRCR